MSTFNKLGVNKDFIKGLNELGIIHPTKIQEKTIPFLLQNNSDFIGLAQTGTGKTLAFGLPLLYKVDVKEENVQTLILSPTRELVVQIKKQLFKFTKYINQKIFIEAVYGGEKIEKQIKNLNRTTHIIVATPGRLIDLIERGDVNLKQIKTLILDEADEMFSMGFKLDINRILKYTSGKINIWLFSATMSEDIKHLVKKYMNSNTHLIEINSLSVINSNILHYYVKTTLSEKKYKIISFLDQSKSERGILFVRTKARARKLTNELQKEGFSIDVLEGDMSQLERDKVMRAFKNKTLQFLVSTDVSARGIDVKGLSFVIHDQLPEQLVYYVHRSGRTARSGNIGGISLAFVSSHELEKINQIQKQFQIKFTEKIL